MMNQILGFGIALLFCAGATLTVETANAEDVSESVSPFYGMDSPDPSRWYHVIEFGEGPPEEVTRAVYARIEAADGPRSNPERLDTVIAYGPGHWTYEWEREASAFIDRATTAEVEGDNKKAKTAYLEAARMYAIGSSPHLRSNVYAMSALEKSRHAYQSALKYVPGVFRVLEVPYAGKTFEAYLFLPPGDGPFPVVVASNGSDVVKEQVGADLLEELAMRGIALLQIDMPGIGGSSEFDLTSESDALHVAAISFIREDAAINGDRVAGMGISFGGNAAARLFLRTDLGLSGVVAVCAPIQFQLPPEAYGMLPPLTVDGVRDRLGLPENAPNSAIAELLKGFTIPPAPEDEFDTIETPLLVLATDQDPVAPPEALPRVTKRAQNFHTIVIHQPGHCPEYQITAPVAAAWLESKLFK